MIPLSILSHCDECSAMCKIDVSEISVTIPKIMNSRVLEKEFKKASKEGNFEKIKSLENKMILDNGHWDDCAHDTKDNGNLSVLQYAENYGIEINWESLMNSDHENISKYAMTRYNWIYNAGINEDSDGNNGWD